MCWALVFYLLYLILCLFCACECVFFLLYDRFMKRTILNLLFHILSRNFLQLRLFKTEQFNSIDMLTILLWLLLKQTVDLIVSTWLNYIKRDTYFLFSLMLNEGNGIDLPCIDSEWERTPADIFDILIDQSAKYSPYFKLTIKWYSIVKTNITQ